MRLIATVLGLSGVCCLTFGILAREASSQHAGYQHVAVDDRRFVRRLTATAIDENEGSSAPTTNNAQHYSLADIDRTQKQFAQGLQGSMNSLLVYDGVNDLFKIYHMKTGDNTASSSTDHDTNEQDPAYLLVDALKAKLPERFQQGQPSFQLLFSTSTHPETDCVMEDNVEDCSAESFAPILHFGSVPKEAHLLPTVKAAPFPSFTSCLIDWKFGRDSSSSRSPTACPLYHMHTDPSGKPYSDTTRWHDLKPQIIWRGSDTEFLPEYKLNLYSGKDMPVQQAIREAAGGDSATLDEDTLAATLLDKFAILTPRLRALALSMFAKRGAATNGSMPWIDAKFNVDEHLDESMGGWGDSFLTNVRISQHEMAQYKYLLDLGGVGGTSQETIAKLALPGVLFHHESLTRDWFHHEDMLPWVHYIPVKMDLSDLREMFVWAETHQHEAEAIARAGTELALRMASDSYMKSTYDSMFGDYMGKVVEAYQPGDYETVESIIAQYEADGFKLTERATCDNDRKCRWVDGNAITYVNGVSSLRKR